MNWLGIALMATFSVFVLTMLGRIFLPSKYDQSDSARTLRRIGPWVAVGVLGFLTMLWASKAYMNDGSGEWIVFGVMIVGFLCWLVYIFGPDRDDDEYDAGYHDAEHVEADRKSEQDADNAPWF